MSSALLDPLVDSSLAKYGFNLKPARKKEIQDGIKQLEPQREAPEIGPGRALWIANYLGFILDRNLLGDAPCGRKFSTWFTSRYPEIAREAERVAEEVISIGFDTPEKMFKALERSRVMLGAGGVVEYFDSEITRDVHE